MTAWAPSRSEYVRVAITREDGTLAVMQFLLRGRGGIPYGATPEVVNGVPTGFWTREATHANIFAEVLRAMSIDLDHNENPRPQPRSYRIVEDSELPQDRTYRDAWIDNGSSIHCDIERAKKSHLEKVRHARAPLLEQLDRDWMRATGQGNKKEADAVEKRRQVLRDLPTKLGLDKVSTVEQLKAVWPSELGGGKP